MLSIAEGSFEVFVVFQRAPEGNPSLFHTHDQTHIYARAPWELMVKKALNNGSLDYWWRIGGTDGGDPMAALALLCLSSRITCHICIMTNECTYTHALCRPQDTTPIHIYVVWLPGRGYKKNLRNKETWQQEHWRWGEENCGMARLSLGKTQLCRFRTRYRSKKWY